MRNLTRSHPCRGRRPAFTLVELLVVIAILAVLISLLIPALRRASIQAREVVCMSNLRQLGLAATAYASDWDGRFPMAGQNLSGGGVTFTGPYWDQMLWRYLSGQSFPGAKPPEWEPSRLFNCPFDQTPDMPRFLSRPVSDTFVGRNDYNSYAVSFSNGSAVRTGLIRHLSVRPGNMRQQARFEGATVSNFERLGPSGVIYLVDFHASRRFDGDRFVPQGRGPGHFGQNFNHTDPFEQYDCHHPVAFRRGGTVAQRTVGTPNALFFDISVRKVDRHFAYRDARIWYANPF